MQEGATRINLQLSPLFPVTLLFTLHSVADEAEIRIKKLCGDEHFKLIVPSALLGSPRLSMTLSDGRSNRGDRFDNSVRRP